MFYLTISLKNRVKFIIHDEEIMSKTEVSREKTSEVSVEYTIFYY